MATIGTLTVKIGADISGLERGLNSAQSKLRAAGSQMRAIGAGLTLGVSAPIAGIATMAVKSAAGFERSMAQIQVATSSTDEVMAQMQAQALELGRVTTFSAGEAAQAQLELAKAGLDASKVMGALPGVLDLAAAGNIDLAKAAEITANTLNAFTLPAEDAAMVANLFAAAANASSADVDTLAQGMTMSSAVFASYDQDVADLATSLALLSNNAVSGSDAGTSLKTMLMRLSAPTAESAAVMADLGLQVYNADGSMRRWRDVIADLETSTRGLTDQQRAAALTTLFGADAIRAANILVKEGAAGYDQMYAAVNAQGAASAMAAANMSGLAGAFEYASGSLDSFLIGQALPFTETLAGMVRGAADLLTAIGELPTEVQRFGAVALGIAAALGPGLIVLGSMATALAALASPMGLVIVGMVVLGAVVAANWSTVASATQAAIETMTPYWETLLGWIDAAKGGDFGPLTEGLTNAAAAMKEMAAAKIDKIALPSFDDVTGRIETALAAVRVDVSQWFSGTIDPRQLFGKMSLTDLFSGNVALGPGGRIAVKFAGEDFDIDFGAVAAKLEAAATALQADVAAAFKGAETAIDVGAVTGWVERNTSALREQIAAAMGSDNVLERTIGRVQGTLATIKSNMQGFGGESVAAQFEAVVSSVVAALGALGAIKFDLMQTAVDGLTQLGTGLAQVATVGVTKIDAGMVQKLITGWFSGLATQMETLLDAGNLADLGGAAGKLTAAVVAKLGEIFGGETFGEDVGVAIGQGAVAIAEGATAFTEAFADALGAVDWSQFGAQIREFVAGMVSGILSQIGPALYENSIFNPEVRKKAMQPENWWADMGAAKGVGALMGGLFTGVKDESAVVASSMAAVNSAVAPLPASLEAASSAANTAATANNEAAMAVSNNAAATAAMANSVIGQPAAMWPGVSSMAGASGTPQLDVTARVTSLETATADVLRPTVEVIGEVTELDTSKMANTQRTVQTAMTQQEAAQSSSAAAFAGAVEQLNSFSFSWPDLPEWVWPRLPTFTWPSLPRWSWPSIPRPSWISSLQVPRPGWLGELLSWSPIVRVQLGGAPAGLPANALGTRSFAGGASLVGEHGPELVSLPAGANIFSANETRAMLSGAGSDGGITINLSGMKIEHDLDLESLAYELAARIDRHRRRRG